MAKKCIFTPEVKSFPIKLNSFGNDYCVVYFHGLLGSSEHKHVLHFIDDLNKNKIDNCSFDFFAHGERKEIERIEDFDLYKYVEEVKMVIHTLKLEGYKKFIFIGESFGGLLAQVLESTKVDCLGIVFLFSVFDFNRVGKGRLNYAEVLKCVKANKPYRLPSATGARQANLSLKFLEGVVKFQNEREARLNFQRNIPKLIIAGTCDSICNFEQAIEFAKNFDDAKLMLVETEHNGYDKDLNKYSKENTTQINKEMIKFIKAVVAVRDYLKNK